ncbi:hypothetical protein [Paraburkholderia sp. UCT31]|nr:hypothetical protein [Paraburkholderia sp. UCT31]
MTLLPGISTAAGNRVTTSLFGTAMNVPYPHLAARLFNTPLSRQRFDENR